MTVVHDTIAAEIAALTPVIASVPVSLGYGTDLACRDDITPTADSVSGLACLTQDIYHWLITEPGTLPGDSPEERSWGFGARQYLHRGITQRDLSNIERLVESGLLGDDRIAAVDATVTFDGRTLRLSLSITPALEAQTFRLILALATDGSTDLEIV